jgi:hypothetical protein
VDAKKKYVHPSDVISPKQHLNLIAVLDDEGPGEGNSAMALIRWDNKLALAMRWNGDDEDENPIGNPQSRGVPTWFVVPDKYVDPILSHSKLHADKLALARNFFPAKK